MLFTGYNNFGNNSAYKSLVCEKGLQQIEHLKSNGLSYRSHNSPIEHSSQAVVKKTKGEKQIIKAGENNKQMIERILHILGGKNVDGK